MSRHNELPSYNLDRYMLFDYLPKKEHLAKLHASWLADKLHDPNLWDFNIRSVPRGVAIGLFVALIPLPFQMLLSIILSIVLRANVPLAIACTWVTNPITFIPINYFIHDLGELVLNMQHQEIIIKPLDLNHDWNNILNVLSNWVQTLGKPFAIGLPIAAFSVAIISYILITTIWYIAIKLKTITDKKE